ncbi:MAG: hypothetical protein ACK58T_06485, partial [Phycisphaerae bacterium]
RASPPVGRRSDTGEGTARLDINSPSASKDLLKRLPLMFFGRFPMSADTSKDITDAGTLR